MKNQSRIPNPEFRIHLVGLVLTMVLLIASLGVFSLTASAAEATIIASGDCSAEGSSVQWTLDDTGTLTISGTGAIESYSIMTHRPWDSYRDDIMSLIIEEGVTEIGVANFKQLKNITAVTLPSTMKKIGINAFAECEQLESVTLNEGLETIDGAAFYNCVSLKTIHLPASLTQLDYNAFVGCALSFTVDEAHAVYSTVDGVLFNKDKTAIVQYRLGNTEYSVPQGVTSIGNYAFSDCTGLTSVKIPNSVTSIDNAFRGCTGLTSIEIPSSVTSINYAFYGCTGLTSIEIPSSVTSMDGAFYNCTGLTSIEIPSSVTSIDNAFRGCTGLTSIEIPSSVISIEGAFRSCTRLTSIEIPSSVTSMDGAFFGCTGLTSIEIPSSVTTIGGSAFYNCTGLTSIEIPNSVTTIGDYAFASCTGLRSVTIPGSVTEVGLYAFYDCTNVSTVTISCTPSAAVYVCIDKYFAGKELIVEHAYEHGFCTVCDTYQPAVNSDSDGYYEIGNAGQLFWFANHVNTVDRTASAVLVADIDLENRPWTPIGVTGENSNNFRGVFDGQNHTIKGLYVEGAQNGVGFFGEVRTGTVKNFTIYGEVIVNTEVDYVGGVIGSICGVNAVTDLERNGAIIQNITSYVNLTAKAHVVGMIGGFVGYASHESLIENCSWYGTFDAGIYCVEDGAGGFIGHIYTNSSVTICNCAAYGTIKTDYVKNSFNNIPTIYMGGFLGFSNTGAGTTLENCLFAGKFERGENLTDRAFLGAFGTLNSVNLIKNCYYLGDGVLEAVHSNSDLKPGSDNVEITSVTKAQLLSGEVAYKLQGTQNDHFWGQTLTGDNRQSYPVLGGEAVPSSRFEIYGQQLNIGGDLSMKYYVMGYAPAFHSGALYMEFSHNAVKTKVYADEPNADGFYVFVLEGINPQCMGDSIYAKLYYNEIEVARHGYEEGKEYSVEKNLLNLLEKYKDDANLVALINDTLAYGKAASEYKEHDTMTGDYAVSDSTIPDATVTPSGAFTDYTVVFGQVNFIKVSVELADGYTLYLDGTDITTQLIDGIFKTDGIAPTEFARKFSFEIKNGDTSVQTFAVSVNDYIGAQKNSATMGNLAKALYNYGVSAEIYNHVANGVGEHTYTYIDNGDGTHTRICVCGEEVIEEHNVSPVTGACLECKAFAAAASITVDGVKTYYATIDEAIAYANGKEGTVIVIENDYTVKDSVKFESGSVTIDLNGKTIGSTSNYLFYNAGGSITIRDSVGGGRTVQSVDGSTVIIEGGTHAELVGGNNLIVTGGNFARVAVTTGETATISGGSFEEINVYSDVGTLAGVLADGYCFYDKDGNAVDVSTVQTDEYGWYNLYNVTVGAIKEN